MVGKYMTWRPPSLDASVLCVFLVAPGGVVVAWMFVPVGVSRFETSSLERMNLLGRSMASFGAAPGMETHFLVLIFMGDNVSAKTFIRKRVAVSFDVVGTN